MTFLLISFGVTEAAVVRGLSSSVGPGPAITAITATSMAFLAELLGRAPCRRGS